MKRKNKYQIAVAIILIAAAFSACSSKNDEVIPLNDGVISYDSYDADSSVLYNSNNSSSLDNLKGVDESSNENPKEKLNTDVDLANSNSDDRDKSEIFVYVCGAVNYPDVYELPADARVVDAIKAAGGVIDGAGEKYLNLASCLKDGEKIYIPTEEEIEEAFSDDAEYVASIVNISNIPGVENINGAIGQNGSSNVGVESDSSNSESGKVNINKASESELMTLPGVGESKAKKIIEYRENNGGFETIEDIMLIPGIKEGMFSKIKDQICVE